MLIRTFSLFLCSAFVFTASASSFPVLTYSTYLRDSFTPKAIATDPSGNIYIAGNAIVDPTSAQTTALIVKLNPQGSQYLYVRYLGGSVADYANAISVDSVGNAYIAGSTASPDFPVTGGGSLGTAPASQSDTRSFVAKFDPNGNLVFSDLLGGSAVSSARAVAVNASSQIVVSGMSVSSFPSTAGAYNIANSANHPYLLELDAAGKTVVFSATGIGGSAMAIDSPGNIYVAGTTNLLDYPTTAGVYQATFPTFQVCYGIPCFTAAQGANQYVTKVDPTGSKLIYSTALSGTDNTTNTGLAVDAAGNVYLTGVAGTGYPYTVTPPAIQAGVPFVIPALPFLSRLDPTGQTLLFSVPLGGAGVQVDSSGRVYVGGGVGSGTVSGYTVASGIPALASTPAQCLPNSLTILNSAYVAQVDSNSGNILGSQFIGGSTLSASGVALSGSVLWIAGATTLADFPFTPSALTLSTFGPGPLPGAYLGAIDFSQPQPSAGTPQIACIVDAADTLAPAGPAARYQLLTILGTGLGPASGATPAEILTTSLAGVTVSFDSVPAPLLYASSTQINLAVPLVPLSQSLPSMQLTVNGVPASARRFPLTYANASLFLNTAETFLPVGVTPGFVAVALNSDGSVNSASNPAQLGSTISVFVNGLTADPQVTTFPLQLYADFGWSVINIALATPYVLGVTLRVPSALVNDFSCPPPSSVCSAAFDLYDVSNGSVADPISSNGATFGGVVYVVR